MTKIRILDASAPPGFPVLLEGASNTKVATAISALSFSLDGEVVYIYFFLCTLLASSFFPIFSFTRCPLFLNQGLVAFSENGLMIRWWSLGSAWWERLTTKSVVPVQCTKLIFVPPWESFSPNSSRLSIMNSILGHDKRTDQEVCSLFFLTFL